MIDSMENRRAAQDPEAWAAYIERVRSENPIVQAAREDQRRHRILREYEMDQIAPDET